MIQALTTIADRQVPVAQINEIYSFSHIPESGFGRQGKLVGQALGVERTAHNEDRRECRHSSAKYNADLHALVVIVCSATTKPLP